MKILFGIDSAFVKKGENVQVIWDSKRAINAHMLIVGKSGTGKTFTLRKIEILSINYLYIINYTYIIITLILLTKNKSDLVNPY